jgi:transposase-like protein
MTKNRLAKYNCYCRNCKELTGEMYFSNKFVSNRYKCSKCGREWE